MRPVAEAVAVLNGKPGRDFASQFPRALVWKTCLREIAILDSRGIHPHDLKPDDEIYVREGAYRFLLEVICGLHSPSVGETEVLGQFKIFAEKAQAGPAWRCTAPWIQRLLSDAKRIRTNHLTGLGSRSYGQLAQQYLHDCERVVVLGAGHLAHETLPWFADREVHVFCRRPEAGAALADRVGHVRIHGLDESLDGGVRTGLVIGAPMNAAEVEEWAESAGCPFDVIVDLRGESLRDPVIFDGTRVVHFEQVLSDLESNCRFAAARVERARKEIAERAKEFWDRYEIRPFGWEDLCA